jgi:hypothetical protein
MHKVFTISGKSSAKPPTDGVSQVTITDSGIELPSKGLPAHGWVKATNNSSVNRDVALAEYASPDATFDQANAYYNEFFNSGKPPAGTAPAALSGGLSGVPKGATGYFQLDLKNGRYVLVSSNQDTQNNDPNPLHTDFTVG